MSSAYKQIQKGVLYYMLSHIWVTYLIQALQELKPTLVYSRNRHNVILQSNFFCGIGHQLMASTKVASSFYSTLQNFQTSQNNTITDYNCIPNFVLKLCSSNHCSNIASNFHTKPPKSTLPNHWLMSANTVPIHKKGNKIWHPIQAYFTTTCCKVTKHACCISFIMDHLNSNNIINVTEFQKINHFVVHETIRIFKLNMVLP